MSSKFKKLCELGLGKIIGCVLFVVAFPAYILNPTNLSWVFHKPSTVYHAMDFHPHYLGWHFLRHAPVSFPLGSIPNFVAPLGTYMAWTDSLPLLAFPLRLISEYLPEDFQYLGLWVLTCCALQGLFAVRILRRFIPDKATLWMAVILVTFSPLLVWRWNHVALMAHWLLLWGIDLNLSERRRVPVAMPALLIVMAALIQPYLAAMMGGLCWALPLRDFIAKNPKRLWWAGDRDAFAKAVATLAAYTSVYLIPLVVVLYVFGFTQGSSMGEGFHWFATDLLSLLNNHGTSSFIPAFRHKAGLAEGYAWPGLGVWLLIGILARRKYRGMLVDILKRPEVRALVIVCGAMWFFAFGSHWFIGTFWIVDMEWFWRPFKFLTASLRTCGRFMWPGYYLLCLAAIILTVRFHGTKAARNIIGVALLLQAVDLGPWIMRQGLRYPVYGRQELTDRFWRENATKLRHIQLIPPHQEGGKMCNQGPDMLYEWAEFAKFAATHNMTINSGYLARYDGKVSFLYCGAQTYEFMTGTLRGDTLYVVRQPWLDRVPLTGPDRSCRVIDGYMTCVALNNSSPNGAL